MILDRFRLDGQVAVVTGGGLGIGRGTAIALAEAGADVVVASRTRSDLGEVVGCVKDAGRRGLAVVTDVMQSEDLERLVRSTTDTFGRLDVLVNNAGGTGLRPAMATSEGCAALYFASSASAWVTGKLLQVYGGVDHPAIDVPAPALEPA